MLFIIITAIFLLIFLYASVFTAVPNLALLIVAVLAWALLYVGKRTRG
jgi:hypothetical protein